MTMRFEMARDALVVLLGSAANGRYRTIGFEAPELAPEELTSTNRLVMVYYKFGTFDKGRGGIQGPFGHDPVYRIEMAASARAQGDLDALDDTSSTDAERATATSAFKVPELLVNNSIDELWGIIFQIIMDARQINISLDDDEFRLGSRWLSNFEKLEIQKGNIVSLTAIADFTCKISEPATGDEGTEVAEPVFDINLNNYQVDSTTADLAKAGVIAKGS